MTRTFAHARVSTLEQDPQNQMREIAAAGLTVEPHRVITAKVSGSMSIERRKGLVRQPEQLGLRHAVLCAECTVGDDPFAVLLADDFLSYNGAGVTADLVNAYETSGRRQLSVAKIDGPDISKYGVVQPGAAAGSVAGLVEKLTFEQAHQISPRKVDMC